MNTDGTPNAYKSFKCHSNILHLTTEIIVTNGGC